MDQKYHYSLKKHEWEDDKRRRRRIRLFTISTIILLCISSIISFNLGRKSVISNESEQISKFEDILNVINEYWYYSTNDDKQFEELEAKAYKALLKFENDPYSEYFTKEEAKAFNDNINRQISGIGIVYENIADKHLIKEVIEDSPAMKAGLKSGDLIDTVDGQSVKELSFDKIKEMITGKKGTSVNIGIIREGNKLNFDIIRDIIDTTVKGYALDDYYFIKFSSFGEHSYNLMLKELDKMNTLGINKLIIDLRNNGGGYLNAIVDIAGLFIKDGSIAINIKYSDGTIEELKENGKYHEVKKIVLLQNENTASAAEALIMALKDNHPNVITVGTTTYGKGVVQSQIDLPDKSVLKITTSEWLSPKLSSIEKKGISPDLNSELHPIFYENINETLNDQSNLNTDGKHIIILRKALDFLGTLPYQESMRYDDELRSLMLKEFNTAELNLDLFLNIYQACFIKINNNPNEFDNQLMSAIKEIKKD